ncbi:hypothetical protein Bbelb_343300 [Branchiostoma belcheri]|nr:hypothetical protein Bbelb_343300 [Branchiostoma belcheri]
MGLTAKERDEVIPGIIDNRIRATIESAITTAFQQGEVLSAIIPTITSAVKDAVTVAVQAELSKLNDQLNLQQKQLQDLTTQVADLQGAYTTLQGKFNDLEQYSRRNCVIVSGIPESPGERGTDEAVLQVTNKINCDPPLSTHDIDRSHRLGKKREDGKPRPVIVKFCSYRSKAIVMKAKSTADSRAILRKEGIFISENLTMQNRKLLYEARLLVKEKRINQAWTYDGKIFIKTIHDERRSIAKPSDLDAFRNPDK